jgi:hypothetical protein
MSGPLDSDTFFILSPSVVVPANAGIHSSVNSLSEQWIPAFAGMTIVISMIGFIPKGARCK